AGTRPLPPVCIGAADEDRGTVERSTRLELSSEHMRMTGRDGGDAAEFADPGDGLGVDVGGDVEQQIPRLRAHQIAGLADPEPRSDPEGEDPRFPVLDDEAVALVL